MGSSAGGDSGHGAGILLRFWVLKHRPFILELFRIDEKIKDRALMVAAVSGVVGMMFVLD